MIETEYDSLAIKENTELYERIVAPISIIEKVTIKGDDKKATIKK